MQRTLVGACCGKPTYGCREPHRNGDGEGMALACHVGKTMKKEEIHKHHTQYIGRNKRRRI
jgi:hypothetical protein